MPLPDQPETITSTLLQQQIGVCLKRVGIKGEHLTISTNGFPIAVLIPTGDYQMLLREYREHHCSMTDNTSK